MQNKWGIRIAAGPVVLPSVLFAGLYLVYLASLSGIYEGSGNAVGRDFVNVWTAGRFLNDGGDAAELFDFRRYIEIQKSYFSPELPLHNWSYPPHLLMIAPLFGALPYPLALVLWVVATTAAFAAAIAAGTDRAWPKAALVALTPAVAVNVFFGQNGLLTAALAVGAVRLLGSRPIAAGVLIAMLTVKPQLGVLFPLLLVAAGRWRTFVSASATTLALVAASAALFGIEPWTRLVGVTLPFQAELLRGSEGFYRYMLTSLFNWADLAGLPGTAAFVLHAALALAAAALAGGVPLSRRWDLQAKGMVTLAATPLVSPYMMNYDLAVLVAPLLFVMARREDRGAGATRLFLLIWLLPAIALAKIWLSLPYAPVLLTWFLVHAARVTHQGEWRLPAFASARAGAGQEAPETQRKPARETA